MRYLIILSVLFISACSSDYAVRKVVYYDEPLIATNAYASEPLWALDYDYYPGLAYGGFSYGVSYYEDPYYLLDSWSLGDSYFPYAPAYAGYYSPYSSGAYGYSPYHYDSYYFYLSNAWPWSAGYYGHHNYHYDHYNRHYGRQHYGHVNHERHNDRRDNYGRDRHVDRPRHGNDEIDQRRRSLPVLRGQRAPTNRNRHREYSAKDSQPGASRVAPQARVPVQNTRREDSQTVSIPLPRTRTRSAVPAARTRYGQQTPSTKPVIRKPIVRKPERTQNRNAQYGSRDSGRNQPNYATTRMPVRPATRPTAASRPASDYRRPQGSRNAVATPKPASQPTRAGQRPAAQRSAPRPSPPGQSKPARVKPKENKGEKGSSKQSSRSQSNSRSRPSLPRTRHR